MQHQSKTTQNHRLQYRLLAMALVAILLLVFGHLILAKSFADMAWTEYTAAAIPFVLCALAYFGFKHAEKAEDE
ncbi:hypothetical protein ACODM8_14020 [Vibrio ostreicida]|uniref:Asparaginyl-tRNA synthetase n=1 Tax=Vibrio ostreicida TaxID=526588 RepID=A0ABT8BVY5_9VIBR|nr:hypothetical protein [Vibrio ostreicida]MDN3610253.1 hypothetical protein [Vibrio ostreicida]NPD07730.1 hypothetical protein [Vibrio ostreicida]